MNIKRSVTCYVIKYVLLTLLVLGVRPAFADELYAVEPYIDFSAQDLKVKSWLAPIANTKNSNEIFFTDIHGKIYLSEGQKINNLPIIDLSKHLTNQTNNKFTAIALHPSFNLIDKEGFNVIYTSHIEVFDSSINKIRLDDEEIKQSHTHDAVVMEWYFNNIDNNPTVIKKREVLRIATSSVDMNINQLSFNPYLKPWSDDYGLLYISLKPDNALKQSTLYSGSILRIKPNKFGLKNYTIPTNNPFIKEPKIKDEIIVVGAQNIQQFTWSKKAKNKLILTHQYSDKQIISITQDGSNYILTSPSNVIYEREINNNNSLPTVYYRGRELNTLWNKIIFIEKSNEQWEFKAANIINQEKSKLSTETVLRLNPNKIGNPEHLSLYLPRENQMLIWDKDQFIIYKVLSNSPISGNNDLPQKSSEADNSNTGLYLFILLIILLILILYIKSNYGSDFIKNKSLLRANFARFEFDLSNNDVRLFKRHETAVSTTLSSLDIASSEIYLNNILINTVSSEPDGEFNEQKENILRLSFEQEHRDKMVDDKVRQITLKITTTKGVQYHICAYLREGNQRLTKEKYHHVIDYVIDWNWYFSSIVKPDATLQRPEKIKLKPQKQFNTVKPSTAKVIQKESASAPKLTTKTSTKLTNDKDVTQTEKASSAKVDTQLIEALNKLVKLKEAGHLTEKEFAVAKTNLLNSLSDSQ